MHDRVPSMATTRRRRSRASWLVLSACLAGTLAMPEPARAQSTPDDLAMTIGVAFDGLVDEGRWVEAQIGLENGGPDRAVELHAVTGATTTIVPVELPAGARKRVPIALRPKDPYTLVRVNVIEDGRVVMGRSYQVEPAGGRQIIAVVGDDPSRIEAVDRLPGLSAGFAVPTRSEDMPEHSLAMLTVDHLVLGEADLGRWRPQQLQALYEWVALGGRLVVAGGADLPARLAALPESLRPAEAGPILDLRGPLTFGSDAVSFRLPDRVPVYELRPVGDAAVIAAVGANGPPLVVARAVGDGQAMALAFDPGGAAMVNWPEAGQMWRWLGFQGGKAAPAGAVDVTPLAAAALGSFEFSVPPIGTAMRLVVAYILVVGPANYLVLRRRRRLDLAWITIPLLTVAATGLTYGLGYRQFGGTAKLFEASSVRVVSGAGIAHVTSFVAIFSPTGRAYDVVVPGAMAFASDPEDYYGWQSRSDVTTVLGAGPTVRGFHLGQWRAGGFALEAVVPWPAAEPGGLVEADGHVNGVVRNPFGRPMRGAEMMVAGDHVWFGELPPDFERRYGRPYVEPRPIHLDLRLLPSDGRTDEEQERRALQIVAAYASRDADQHRRYGSYYGSPSSSAIVPSRDGAELFAFDGASALDLRMDGRIDDRQAHVLVHAAVPLERGAPAPRRMTGWADSEADRVRCVPGGVTLDDTGQLDARVMFDAEESRLNQQPVWLSLRCPSIPDTRGEASDLGDLAVEVSLTGPDTWIPLGILACDDRMWLPPLGSDVDFSAQRTMGLRLRLPPGANPVAAAGLDGAADWQELIVDRGGEPCWVPVLDTDAATTEDADG